MILQKLFFNKSKQKNKCYSLKIFFENWIFGVKINQPYKTCSFFVKTQIFKIYRRQNLPPGGVCVILFCFEKKCVSKNKLTILLIFKKSNQE